MAAMSTTTPNLGCDQLKGHLLGPPVPDDAIEYMAKEKRRLPCVDLTTGRFTSYRRAVVQTDSSFSPLSA